MKRIVLAGIAGGVVLFLWGAVAHMLLNIDAIGLRVPADEAQPRLLAALADNLDGEGVYVVPMLQKDQWADATATAAFVERQAQSPYAFVVYQPQGQAFVDAMGANMLRQLLIGVLASLFAAWLVARARGGYVTRVALVGGLGVFAWLVADLPMWNWYRFPLDHTLARLLEHGIGWVLAGLVVAAIVGRESARHQQRVEERPS